MTTTDSPAQTNCHERKLFLAGLELDVYEPITEQNTENGNAVEADVLILLHGRTDSKENVASICRSLVPAGNASSERGKSQIPFHVIAFDLPNHGTRERDQARNWGWVHGNKHYVFDLWSFIRRALLDIRLVMDMLPLVPDANIRVRRWALGGISLGGHITAIGMAEDPRISMGMMIIGCGNLHRLLSTRASATIGLDAKTRATLEDTAKMDATNRLDQFKSTSSAGVGSSRSLLILHGDADELVPWSSNEHFVAGLRKRMRESPDEEASAESIDPDASSPTSDDVNGKLRIRVLSGVGHHIPESMVQSMMRWVKEWMADADVNEKGPLKASSL